MFSWSIYVFIGHEACFAGLEHPFVDNDGIYLFIAEVSYVAGGSIKGSFTGTAKTANGEMVSITDGTYNVKFVN